MRPQIQWQTASPLWDAALEDKISNKRFRQPALLRFASDNFMEDLEKILNSDQTPSGIKGLCARHETWKDEAAGWLTEAEVAESDILKLYQPAQGRFYLVAASLVCRLPGLPDSFLDIAKGEKVSFVLRRLVPLKDEAAIVPSDPATYMEYGWFSNGQGSLWRRIDNPKRADPEEERLPMFSMNFKTGGKKRRLLTGFIPVGSREVYQAAPELTPLAPPGDEPGEDMRLSRFETSVIEPINGLFAELAKGDETPIKREQAQEILLFILLDLAEFLNESIKEVWEAVEAGSWARPIDNRKSSLFERLHTTTFYAEKKLDWALNEVFKKRADIISGAIKDPGSGALLVTGHLAEGDILRLIDALKTDDMKYTDQYSFNSLVKDALGPLPPAEGAGYPEEAVPKIYPGKDVFYVIRCVYERPGCKGIYTPIVSEESSQPFQMAQFFDPDAPARAVHIPMPVDTSISGLRKFPKKVSFLISNKLRQQMERVKGVKLEDLDNGDIEQEKGFDMGRICSFSIPIITICALILLMIIVQLLNIIFWWLPFFKICLPLNLKVE